MHYLALITLVVIIAGAIGSIITADVIDGRHSGLDYAKFTVYQTKPLWFRACYRFGHVVIHERRYGPRRQSYRIISWPFRKLYRVVTYFPLKNYRVRKAEEARVAAAEAAAEEKARIAANVEATRRQRASEQRRKDNRAHAREHASWRCYKNGVDWVLRGEDPDGRTHSFAKMEAFVLDDGTYMLDYYSLPDKYDVRVENHLIVDAEGIMIGDRNWLIATERWIIDGQLGVDNVSRLYSPPYTRSGDYEFMRVESHRDYTRGTVIHCPMGTRIGISDKERAFPDDGDMYRVVIKSPDGVMDRYVSAKELQYAIRDAYDGLRYGRSPRRGIWVEETPAAS